jgi:predicted glycogen debranching enzyme
VFAEIISWQARGTRYGIKVDPSGLLASGELGVQLTWMDAKVGDWVVTPRRGKPVEIQALWYNALCIMEDLAFTFGDEAAGKLSAHGRGRALEFQPAFLERKARLLVRRGK